MGQTRHGIQMWASNHKGLFFLPKQLWSRADPPWGCGTWGGELFPHVPFFLWKKPHLWSDPFQEIAANGGKESHKWKLSAQNGQIESLFLLSHHDFAADWDPVAVLSEKRGTCDKKQSVLWFKDPFMLMSIWGCWLGLTYCNSSCLLLVVVAFGFFVIFVLLFAFIPL